MTIVRARIFGDEALLPQADLERLLELARRTEEVELELHEEDVPARGIMKLAEQGGAFDWLASEEELYTVDDLKVRHALDL